MTRYDPPQFKSSNGSRQWRKDPAVAHWRWVAAVCNEIADQVEQAWDNCAQWTPGVPSTSLDGSPGGAVGDDGAKNGRTPHLALRRLSESSNGPAIDMNIILMTGERVGRPLGRALAAMDRLRIADPRELTEVLEPVTRIRKGAGECVNQACRRFCTGTGDDRLRSGRCPACRAYKNRTGTDRPHDTALGDQAHPRDLCKLCLRDSLLEAGADPNDVVGLVDEATR